MAEPQYLSRDNAAIVKFVDQFDVFLFDCDGVLWSGDHLIEGAAQTLDKLRKRGKRIVFVTNNSTKSRSDYREKLMGMGIAATDNEVFPSSYAAAIYISRILALPSSKNKVYILGEKGIETELESESIPYLGGSDVAYRRDMTPEDFTNISSGAALDPSVGTVLLGIDFHLNYLKLAYAYHYVKQNGAVLLATNSDTTFPSSKTLFPGAGACAAPLIAMLGGQKPEVLGKPSQNMMDAVQSKFQFDRAKACMVGDRLDTDIAFGIKGKLGGTLCVLTGVTKSKDDWKGSASADKIRPSAWVDSLGDLAHAI